MVLFLPLILYKFVPRCLCTSLQLINVMCMRVPERDPLRKRRVMLLLANSDINLRLSMYTAIMQYSGFILQDLYLVLVFYSKILQLTYSRICQLKPPFSLRFGLNEITGFISIGEIHTLSIFRWS